VKRVLALPPDTIITWKSHDDSIAQRTALDQARQEKSQHEKNQHEKRRATITQDDGLKEKAQSAASNVNNN
jgi:translation initiation factor 4E